MCLYIDLALSFASFRALLQQKCTPIPGSSLNPGRVTAEIETSYGEDERQRWSRIVLVGYLSGVSVGCSIEARIGIINERIFTNSLGAERDKLSCINQMVTTLQNRHSPYQHYYVMYQYRSLREYEACPLIRSSSLFCFNQL